MFYFSGVHEYKVDEKGRVPVPPKFRKELRGEVVMMPGVEKCVQGYAKAGFERLVEKLGADMLAPSKLRKLRRHLLGNAYQLQIDGQGRVMLPAQLRTQVGITDSVVIAGAGMYFELWNPELWNSEKTTDAEEAWQIVEGLQAQGQ